MKKLMQSFYGKLSLTFLILLLAMGVVQIFISVQSSIEFVKEADQRMNKTLARSIGADLEPFLGATMDMPGIEHMMHYLMVMNPAIEIYLLDKNGKVLAFFAEPAKKVEQEQVNVEPIKAFIERNGEVALLGDDPRHAGRLKSFSASPIRLNDNTNGYIYVILGGEQFDYATASLWDSFMLSTAGKSLLVSVIATAVIGLVLFFFMTKRLRRMNATVRHFGEGDFEKRLPVTSSDEFGQLATTFNQMADTIVANMDELKRTDDLRRELVANVSHDLRSPLASVQGYLETASMKFDTLSAEEKKSYIEVSLRNIDKLNRLVHELFELSKLDAHQIEPQLEPLSISELVQDVVMKYKPETERRGLEFDAVLKDGLPLIKADIGMIERVLANLIENAIRHTKQGDRIKVEPLKHHSGVRVKVSDTGCGIPAEDLPHIFNRFYSGQRTGEQGEGTGLGLAIARKIIELHGGEINVESQLDQGTTFSFDLHAERHLPTQSAVV
ncbi:MAG: HAMP domain-containing sensor histidine kinase [bacterium]